MEIYVTSLLFLTAFFGLFRALVKSVYPYVLVFLFLQLSLVAAFRDGQYLPDYATYAGLYGASLSGDYFYFIEPSFHLVVFLANFIFPSDPLGMFLIYALLGVYLKLYVISKISNYFFLAVLIYLSNYYILHELIQIRAGVASGFGFLALYFIENRKILFFYLALAFSVFFHLSGLVYLALLIFVNQRFSSVIWLFFISTAYLFHILFYFVDPMFFLTLFSSLSVIHDKLSVYIASENSISTLNVFGIVMFSKLTIGCFLIKYQSRLAEASQFFYPLLKLYLLGIFCYVAFAHFPQIGVRLSQLFFVSEIFLLPMVVRIINPRQLGVFLVCLYALMQFYLNISFTSYFRYTA